MTQEQILVSSTDSILPPAQLEAIHPLVLGDTFRLIAQFLQQTPFCVELHDNTMQFSAMDTGRIALFHVQISLKENIPTPMKFMMDFSAHSFLIRQLTDAKMTWNFSDPTKWIIQQSDHTITLPIPSEESKEEYDIEPLQTLRQNWVRAQFTRSEFQSLRSLMQGSEMFTITVEDEGLKFSTEVLSKRFHSLHVYDRKGIACGTTSVYSKMLLKPFFGLFKAQKFTGNNTWITLQFTQDSPLYIGYEEKREMSHWAVNAWIAPRAEHESEEEESDMNTEESTPKESSPQETANSCVDSPKEKEILEEEKAEAVDTQDFAEQEEEVGEKDATPEEEDFEAEEEEETEEDEEDAEEDDFEEKEEEGYGEEDECDDESDEEEA